MTKVVLLGTGNLGQHLARVLLRTSTINLVQIYNRTLSGMDEFSKVTQTTNDINQLQKADVYIICVNDQAIKTISEKITDKKALIVHTSGASSIDILHKHPSRGIFYPLQSFTKNREIDFKEIPICIEANTKDHLFLLKEIANSISNVVYQISSQQRQELHKAAVFVNNFVNHLYYIGGNICKENNLDSNILYPLIKETSRKIEELSPFDAQTGPARRGDLLTIKNHMKNLTATNKEIYKLLSQSIASTYGKKL